MKFGFSGPRSLTCEEEWIIESYLMKLVHSSSGWSVGDAPGADELVQQVGHRLNIPLVKFWVLDQSDRYQFSKRSKQLVDHIYSQEGELIAFPNRPCPEACYPCSSVVGGGSGTWLTIAYATYRKVPVKVIPIGNRVQLPQWLTTKQLTMF